MKKLIFILIAILSLTPVAAQNFKQQLNAWLKTYERTDARTAPAKLVSLRVDDNSRHIDITIGDGFQEQHFTPSVVESIYSQIKSFIPKEMKNYSVTVITDDRPIEELIPPYYLKKQSAPSRLAHATYKGMPWVCNTSRPYTASQGLEGTHISLWQSHGRYYKAEQGIWKWQRPRLFCTCEDLLSQTFVVPYIIPMLQNAGAIVFTPRERDIQSKEVIVDSDKSTYTSGSYMESYEKKRPKQKWETSLDKGFAYVHPTYTTADAPFQDGSARIIPTVTNAKKTACALWVPDMPADGKYAVYVNYHSYPNSADDAHYIVRHKGGETEFRINQKIGGDTWVYLGTFDFAQGQHDTGMVILTNQSKHSSAVVCADAVRFGGGMGNVTQPNAPVSQMPRWAEAAKYSALWYGFPSKVHSDAFGSDDYKNDINSRSAAVNYLSRGSVFNSQRTDGKGVPFELNIAFHTDAGYRTDGTILGSLAIYKTAFNDGKTGDGTDRYSSRDLSSMLLTELHHDLSKYNWTVRKLWNRDYGEAREPMTPCCILEMLSHQSFADMQLAYDPQFRFDFSRSVYKTVVKYLATMHQRPYVIQPLPVKDMAIQLNNDPKHTITLSWAPASDPLEPTATPDQYIVYTRIGSQGFDNGTLVKGTRHTVAITPGIPYSFRVTALNKGGESFPSETLSAAYAPQSRGQVLVVNGFNRLSGPAAVNTTTTQGFDLDLDPGVPYGLYAGYCGRQTGWEKSKAGKETSDGLGVSGDELEGQLFMGNTFDYTTIHGRAILSAGYSYASVSESSLFRLQSIPQDYYAVDIYYGVQKSFYVHTKNLLSAFQNAGGRLILSGANISDKSVRSYSINQVTGCRLTFDIYREMNSESYAVPTPSVLQPTNGEFAMMAYSDGSIAATASNLQGSRSVRIGFPLEAIKSQNVINQLMAAFLTFLK